MLNGLGLRETFTLTLYSNVFRTILYKVLSVTFSAVSWFWQILVRFLQTNDLMHQIINILFSNIVVGYFGSPKRWNVFENIASIGPVLKFEWEQKICPLSNFLCWSMESSIFFCILKNFTHLPPCKCLCFGPLWPEGFGQRHPDCDPCAVRRQRHPYPGCTCLKVSQIRLLLYI